MRIKPLLDPDQRRIRHVNSVIVRNLTVTTNTAQSGYNVSVPLSPTSTLRKQLPSSNSRKELIRSKSDSLNKLCQTGSKEQAELEAFYQVRLPTSFYTLHLTKDDPPFYVSAVEYNCIDPNYPVIDQDFSEDESVGSSKSFVVKVWAATKPLRFYLAIQWVMSLSCLTYMGSSLASYKVPLGPNTIIIGLSDGFYTCPANENTGQQYQKQIQEENRDSVPLRSKRSYNCESIMRLNTLLECIQGTKSDTTATISKLDTTLARTRNVLDLQRRKNEINCRVAELHQVLEKKISRANDRRKQVNDHRENLSRRRTTLKVAENDLKFQRSNLESAREELQVDSSIYASTAQECERLRLKHISTVCRIYPIEPVPDLALLFQIRDIILPSTAEYKQDNDDMTSTALGYAAHLVNLLAFYLCVPLRYPLFPMSSRSTIRDPISIIQGTRKFPLFAQDVDRYRYEYGLFLLNKDIEQLLNYKGILVMDLRQTLPNLKYLVLVLVTNSDGESTLKELSNGNAVSKDDEVDSGLSTALNEQKMRNDATMNNKRKNKSRFERFFPSRLQSLPGAILSAGYPASMISATRQVLVGGIGSSSGNDSPGESSTPTPISYSPLQRPNSETGIERSRPLSIPPLQLEAKHGSDTENVCIDSREEIA